MAEPEIGRAASSAQVFAIALWRARLALKLAIWMAVTYAAAQEDLAGVDQVNVELPQALSGRGKIAVNVVVNKFHANTVTVTIR